MIKKIIVSIYLFSFLTLPVFAGGLKDSFGTKLGTVAGPDGAGYEITTSGDSILQGQISKFIQLALSFLGVIFLSLTIYAGFLWMTAQGNEAQVKKAKEIMTRAVTGLIIVVSAYSISYLVISKLGEGQLKNLQ